MATYRKKWFNPLYFILDKIIETPTIRTVLVYGGKSSSKTISIAQQIAIRCNDKGNSAMTFRKENSTIKTTLKKSFDLVVDRLYLYPAFERLEFSYRNDNGAEIVMKGMDDEEKAKGVEGYKYVYFDELNHFDQGEWEQADLSMRGIPGQKIFGSWNPVSDSSWIKTEIVDKTIWKDTDQFGTLPCANSFIRISEDGTTILIKTTYEDNYWIVGRPDGDNGVNREFGYRDQLLIDRYDKLATTNANSYKVNVLGEWGKTTYGGEFLKKWRSEKHTGNYPYNPNLAIYAIFDENVNPYFPCGLFQIGDDQKSMFLIHAIAMKNPDNTTRAMGREIARKLMEWGHKGKKLYIGGDPTSKKEDVKQEKGHDFFRLMVGELIEFKPELRVLSSPPSVLMSGDFVNSILDVEVDGLSFRADKSCRVAIADYENTKEDKNGKIDKKTEEDPKTKVRYQPWGHFVDLTRYFICQAFAEEYARYQSSGEVIHPRSGKTTGRKSTY